MATKMNSTLPLKSHMMPLATDTTEPTPASSSINAVGSHTYLKCDLCEYSFLSDNSLKQHIKTHMSAINSLGSCEGDKLCDKSLEAPSSTELIMPKDETNQRIQANGEETLKTEVDNPLHQCCLCTETFLFSHQLMEHLETHSMSRKSASESSAVFSHDHYDKNQNDCSTNLSGCLTDRNSSCANESVSKCEVTEERMNCCNLCNKTFMTRDELLSHMDDHCGGTKLTCGHCHESFTAKRKLRQHILSHSDITRVEKHECEFCKKQFKSAFLLKNHRHVHTGERPFKCSHCGQAFRRKGTLQNHINRRTCTGAQCHLCTARFKSLASLANHERQVHGVKQDAKGAFVSCEHCNKLVARHAIAGHRRSHTGEKPFKCHVCAAAFATASYLNRHLPTHDGVKRYVCDVCGAKFLQKFDLKVHIRYHTGEKPFPCRFCDKRFTTSTVRKRHERSHTDKRRYECDVCSCSYSREDALIAHKKCHTGKNLFLCNFCDASFTTSGGLKRHERSHNDNLRYECDLCSCSYVRKDTLKMHKDTKHSEVKSSKARLA